MEEDTFILIQKYTPDDFTQVVNERLKEGYKVIGGPFSRNDSISSMLCVGRIKND